MVRLLLLILAAAVLLAPFEMRFTPYSGFAGVGAWDTDLSRDPQFALRNGLIVLNLLLAAAAVGIYLVALGRALFFGRRTDDLVVGASITLLIFFISWTLVPFWVNGVHQAYLQQAIPGDLDPQALLPATWLGNSWNWVAVTTIPTILVLLPVLTLAAVVEKLRGQPWRRTLLTLACLAATTYLMFADKAWGEWLLD